MNDDTQLKHEGLPDCKLCKETALVERSATTFACPRELGLGDGCVDDMECQICSIHRQMNKCKDMLGNKIKEIDKKVDDLTEIVERAIKER